MFVLLTVWFDIDGSVYHAKTVKMNWTSANEYCRNLNAHLIRLETKAELDLIHDLMSENPSEFNRIINLISENYSEFNLITDFITENYSEFNLITDFISEKSVCLSSNQYSPHVNVFRYFSTPFPPRPTYTLHPPPNT